MSVEVSNFLDKKVDEIQHQLNTIDRNDLKSFTNATSSASLSEISGSIEQLRRHFSRSFLIHEAIKTYTQRQINQLLKLNKHYKSKIKQLSTEVELLKAKLQRAQKQSPLHTNVVGQDLKMAYMLLGVDVTADAQEVKKAYRKKVIQAHPDKGGDVDHFKCLNQAMLLIIGTKA